MEFGVRTDIGRVRENNEDSLRFAPELNLFVLADGMGGQASGEVASRLASETIVAHCQESASTPSLPITGDPLPGFSDFSNRLASAIRLANQVVYQAAQQNPGQHGMGSTVVACWIHAERMSVAHVGDSRAYLFRDGNLQQLTEDHSFVSEQLRRGVITPEQAAHSTLQNVLMRALGVEPEVEPDVDEHLLTERDAVLLCSDGLTRELSDSHIAAVLQEMQDAQAAADRLVFLANQNGGGDNVSVIVVRPLAKSSGAFSRIGRWLNGES
jgi:PPM family protein phosphatase